jgi:AraC-like DNA-binding protein
VKFETYIPTDILKPFIKSFILHETANETTYKVLPGTALVIGFQYKGRLAYLDDKNEIPLAVSGVTGIMDRYKVFKNSPGIGTVLVNFTETGAAAFFKQPLHELFRESLSLDNFMLRSELLVLEEQLQEAKNDSERISVVEQFLINRLNPPETDEMVLAALSIIHKTKGNIRIKELAVQLHTSQSPLEKRFRKIVGASPKKFASIVRLKNALQIYSPQKSLTDLGYEAGFYDQAHFIKEFKTFTGDTPEDYFSGNK